MNTPRFLYHASAVGVAGEVRRPFQQVIHCQASSALPRYGGHAHSRVDKFQLADIVKHSACFTHATGIYNKETDSFETTVQSTVADIDVRGVVTADLTTAKVHSNHPNKPGVEPSITVEGSEIKGLRVAGRVIDLEPRVNIYCEHTTLSGLRKYYSENKQFQQDFESEAFVDNEAKLPEDVLHFFPWRRRKSSTDLHHHNNMVIVPLYKVKNPSERGFEVYGNVIKVHDFGRVHIGELIIEGNRRRVMMLHVDMGSPCEGCVSFSCGDGNGGQVPPPDGGV